jgi:retron-type reverse transcriptase
MGLWDLIKRFLGGTGLPAGPSASASSVLERRLEQHVLSRIQGRAVFQDSEVAQAALDRPTPHNIGVACQIVERLYRDDVLAVHRYRRVFRPAYGGTWLFHPVEVSEADAKARPQRAIPPPAPAPAVARPAVAQPAVRTPPPPRVENPYTSEILGLSPDELRKRALRITPWRTAWIGRVDTIPPQSDERTAIIDRGLVLRGLLDEVQLAEIHRVGDLWIRHHDAMKLAEAAASRTADAAVEEEQRKKAEIKEQKKRESAERRAQRSAAVAKRRAEDIVFLGRGVSSGLADRRSHVERLQELGLPVLSTPADVARALGLELRKLRWLCFHTEAAQRTHYVYFEVPKRSGGVRQLAAPHRSLAAAQRFVLAQILEKIPVEAPAHGFVKGHSTVTNAEGHRGRDVVINLDLSDFFPSIGFRRVRGVFHKLGYSPAASTVLALLCTECPRRQVEFDGRPYWVAVGERALPQGACTSPALSNLVARRLDRRLSGLAKKRDLAYTRYADDLTFSLPEGRRGEVPMLLARIRHVIQEEHFGVNPRKGRVQRRGGRQQVTGIVVNDKLGVPREEVRRLRAILHGARKTGLEAQNREGRPAFGAWLRGMIAYVAMVDRPKGLALLRELDALPR